MNKLVWPFIYYLSNNASFGLRWFSAQKHQGKKNVWKLKKKRGEGLKDVYVSKRLTRNSKTGKSWRLFQLLFLLIWVKNGTQTNLTLPNLTTNLPKFKLNLKHYDQFLLSGISSSSISRYPIRAKRWMNSLEGRWIKMWVEIGSCLGRMWVRWMEEGERVVIG